MSKKNTQKALSAIMLASASLNAVGAIAEDTATVVGDYTLTQEETQNKEIKAIENVEGTFEFCQDVLSPSEDVFNLYGTVVTGMCAKPAFAFEKGNEEGGTYYINVAGNMEFSKAVTLDDLKDKTSTKVASCSCSTGAAVTQAQVSGIPLTALLQVAQLPLEDQNTLTVTGSDGYSVSMPLKYALDKEAMLVYQINGEELKENQRTQLWMPGAVAKYFARDVVEVKVTKEEKEPEIIQADAEYRAKINIVNHAPEAQFKVGEAIRFEGFADDVEAPITAIEFSMDGGNTWKTCETKETSVDRWVYWFFTVTPETEGSYELIARARTADEVVSPLTSSVYFDVVK